jgi:hypothetical protein
VVRLGGGERILVVAGGERCTLLRRGLKEGLLSLPRSLTGSISPCMMASDSLSSGSSMSSSSSSSMSGSDVGKVGSISWGIGLCLAASRSFIRVM